MPYEVDYVAYHRSISDEFKAIERRVQHLIADHHWLTDGEQRETIFRKTLKSHLPESFSVVRGFICYESEPSSQLDVMIINKSHPTLFKEGDLVIVTPDCVEAIIEIKTEPDASVIRDSLGKLADQVEKLRRAKNIGGNAPFDCWSGLFVFRGPENNNGGALTRKSRNLLQSLYDTANHDPFRVVNCVSIGPNLFSRYWGVDSFDGHRSREGGWHSYLFSGNEHHDLAPAYFVSNLTWALMKHPPRGTAYAYFPIRDLYGKEKYRKHHAALNGNQVESFS